MADPKDLAAQLEAFNAIEAQAQPWYKKQLPMEGRATFLPYRDTMEGSVFNQRELAMPGILAGALNAFSSPERARTGSDPTFNPNEEAINFAQNVMGGGVGTSAAMKAPMGQGGKDLAMNAYHGTPHEIQGGFDLAKVGTGEGAQAYGHGMYFGEARGTGEMYRDTLGFVGAKDKSGEVYGKDGISFFFENALENSGVPSGAAKSQAQLWADKFVKGETINNSIANKVIETKGLQPNKVGNLYKVDIPDEQIPMMLDWDKPFNQQSNIVKQGLNKLGIIVDEKAYKSSLDDLEAALLGNNTKDIKDVPNPSGKSIYNKLVAKFGSQEKASQELNKLGITGIRYLDEQSRGKNAGTSNFVVFKPETVKILEKNDKPVSRKELLKQEFDKLDK